MQPSDIHRLVNVGQPTLSPDASTVAFVVQRVDAEADRYRSAIWAVPVDGSQPARALTDGPALDQSPAWSPDGRLLAFVRTLPSTPPSHQLVVLAVDGPGEPHVLAEGPEAFAEITWAPDGRSLAGSVRVRTSGDHTDDRSRPARHIENLRSRHDSVGWVVDRRRQIFVIGADGITPLRTITSGPFEHSEPRWSPDGSRLAFVAARHDDWDLTLASDVFIVDPLLDEPELQPLTDTTLEIDEPTWSPDGTRIAALTTDNSTIANNTQLSVIDASTGKVTVLTQALDRTCLATTGPATPVWTSNDSLLFTCEDHGAVPLLRTAADGSGAAAVVLDDRWITAFDARGATIAFTATRHDQPMELFSLIDGVERQLTDVQADFVRRCPPLAIEQIAVASPAGDGELDVWLCRPPGFDASTAARYPALLTVHGGPMTQYGNRWFDEVQLYASAGYVVVFTNPHGSTGRTNAFLRAIRSPGADIDPGTGWGGIDYDDLLAALDGALAHEPAIDADRVGIIGGSYGGYIASWAIGHTTRFAAAVSERAVNNFVTLEWTSDIAGIFRLETGLDPWAGRAELERQSPITYVQQIETPVLILHSENDLRCAIEQADQLFAQLRLLGKPVEYWRFPGESHEMSRSGSPSHRIQRAELILDFFGRYLRRA